MVKNPVFSQDQTSMISNNKMNPSNMNSNNISVYNDNKHIKSYNGIEQRNTQNDWKALVKGNE